MAIDFEKLHPQFYFRETLWVDFFAALSEVLEEEIRNPIHQLRDIRDVVESTDPYIIKHTLADMGFDLPAEFIAHNAERLARSVHMLSMFHELSGTDGFERTIQYVLGREIQVITLWTNDYSEFFAEPGGALLADGGDWYQTTHIRLGMELMPDDGDAPLPLNTTLSQRLMDLYFEFASVAQVVHEFVFLINARASLYLSGIVVHEPVHYIPFGRGQSVPSQLTVVGQQYVYGNTEADPNTYVYHAEALFSNTPCTDTSKIRVGTGYVVNADANNLAIVDNSVGTITVDTANGFGWCLTPVELGNVQFFDATTGFATGWDGAGWPLDSIGTSTGPTKMMLSVRGVTSEWNVWRTDLRDIGVQTFYLAFDSLRNNSCEDLAYRQQFPATVERIVCEESRVVPQIGVLTEGVVTGAQLVGLQYLPNTDNQNITLNIENGFGYCVFPTALGFATFLDIETQFIGGWDGASWPVGQVGTGSGPITINVEIAGQIVPHYLYRTDLADLGQKTFSLVFANAGQNTVVSTCVDGISDFPLLVDVSPTSAADLASPVNIFVAEGRLSSVAFIVDEPLYLVWPPELGALITDAVHTEQGTVDRTIAGAVESWNVTQFAEPGMTVVKFSVPQSASADGKFLNDAPPLYGTASRIETFADLSGFVALTGNQFSVNVGSTWGWFAYPAALGRATFESDWDGATWLENRGLGEGPTLVWKSNGDELIPYYVYRTNVNNIGNLTTTVSFEHDIPIGERHTVDLGVPNAAIYAPNATLQTAFPRLGTGPAGYNSDMEIGFLTDLGRNVQSLTFTVPQALYGYFAVPATTGFINFYENGVLSTDWATDGDEAGPLRVVRNIGGVPQDWYLYRTKHPGIGSKTYTIKYGEVPYDKIQHVQRVQAEWTTDRYDLVTFHDNKTIFRPVLKNTSVNIFATFRGLTAGMQIVLQPNLPQLEYIEVSGETDVYGNAEVVLDVQGRYSDGYFRPVQALVTVASPDVSVTGHKVRCPNANATLFAQVSVKTIRAVHTINVTAIPTNVYVTGITINGPDSVEEGVGQAFTADVAYSNGITRQEQVVWESNTPALEITPAGVATAIVAIRDYDVAITASFQYDGIVTSTTKRLGVRTSAIFASRLEIIGPATVQELSAGQFYARMLWSDGSHTKQEAEWSTSKFAIDAQGILTTGSTRQALPVSLRAQVAGIVATLVISVYPTPNRLEYISVYGADELNEGNTTQYRTISHYSDGSMKEVPGQFSIVGSPAWAQIIGGHLSFANPQSSLIEVQGQYTVEGVVRTGRKTVVLVPRVNRLRHLIITGPTEVREHERITLVATAVYDDGQTEVVNPTWTVRTTDPVNEPEPDAYIVSPGIVQGRLVQEDRMVIVGARYFQEEIDYPVIVRYVPRVSTDVPLQAWIEGPEVVPAGEDGYFDLMILFEGCATPLSMPATWAIDVDPEIAIVRSSGIVTNLQNEEQHVVLNAVWECEGRTISAEYPTQLAGDTVFTKLLIIGPVVMAEQTSQQYEAEVFTRTQQIVPGRGRRVLVDWTVSGSLLVTVNQQGLVTAGDLDANASVTLVARYTENDVDLIDQLNIIVTGSKPPVVDALFIHADTMREGTGTPVHVEVFRENMSVLAGTGIRVPHQSVVYGASVGNVSTVGIYGAPLVNTDTVATLTAVGTYEDFEFDLEGQIDIVNIVPIGMLLTGATSAVTGTIEQYQAEVFYTGQEIIAGQGTVNPPEVVWTIPDAVAGISINQSGVVSIDADDVTFNVTATVGTITRQITVTVAAEIEYPFQSGAQCATVMTFETYTDTMGVTDNPDYLWVIGGDKSIVGQQDTTAVRVVDTRTYSDESSRILRDVAFVNLAERFYMGSNVYEVGPRTLGNLATMAYSTGGTAIGYRRGVILLTFTGTAIETLKLSVEQIISAAPMPEGYPDPATAVAGPTVRGALYKVQGRTFWTISLWFQAPPTIYVYILRIFEIVNGQPVFFQDLVDSVTYPQNIRHIPGYAGFTPCIELGAQSGDWFVAAQNYGASNWQTAAASLVMYQFTGTAFEVVSEVRQLPYQLSTIKAAVDGGDHIIGLVTEYTGNGINPKTSSFHFPKDGSTIVRGPISNNAESMAANGAQGLLYAQTHSGTSTITVYGMQGNQTRTLSTIVPADIRAFDSVWTGTSLRLRPPPQDAIDDGFLLLNQGQNLNGRLMYALVKGANCAPERVVTGLLVHGGDRMLVNTTSEFRAEVFYDGAPIVSGQGTMDASVTWTVTSVPAGSTPTHVVTSPGRIDVTSNAVEGNAQVKATYQGVEASSAVEIYAPVAATILIHGPSAVLPNSNTSYDAEVFFEGEPVIPGQGAMNPVSLYWTALGTPYDATPFVENRPERGIIMNARNTAGTVQLRAVMHSVIGTKTVAVRSLATINLSALIPMQDKVVAVYNNPYGGYSALVEYDLDGVNLRYKIGLPVICAAVNGNSAKGVAVHPVGGIMVMDSLSVFDYDNPATPVFTHTTNNGLYNPAVGAASSNIVFQNHSNRAMTGFAISRRSSLGVSYIDVFKSIDGDWQLTHSILISSGYSTHVGTVAISDDLNYVAIVVDTRNTPTVPNTTSVRIFDISGAQHVEAYIYAIPPLYTVMWESLSFSVTGDLLGTTTKVYPQHYQHDAFILGRRNGSWQELAKRDNWGVTPINAHGVVIDDKFYSYNVSTAASTMSTGEFNNGQFVSRTGVQTHMNGRQLLPCHDTTEFWLIGNTGPTTGSRYLHTINLTTGEIQQRFSIPYQVIA